ncbi:MAG: hypothetical protein ABI239_05805 [Aquihabitans sp.]
MNDELVAIMGRLAAGDGAAVRDLVERFGSALQGTVRSLAAHRGARLRAEEVDEVVLDVAIVLAHGAPSWRADGGAPPWVWARHRIANVVDGYIGQWAVPLDETHQESYVAPPVATVREESVLAVLASIGQRSPVAALLGEAIGRVATLRDQEIYLEVLVEMGDGNRAPADAVARLHGLTSAAVRQQCRRVRLRLQRLAATEERFASLAGIPAVA